MTLRKCIFVLMIIENGVSEISGATTEIIYKPLKCSSGAFTFQPELRADYYVPFKKSALHRVGSNLMEFCAGLFSLAIEIN